MAQEYEIDIMRFNGQDYDTLLPTPAAHATTHQADGSDPITMQTGNYGVSSIPTSAYQNASVTRVKIANDALYSPFVVLNGGEITINHIGATVRANWNTTVTYNISQENSSAIPIGAEIAIYNHGDSSVITVSAVGTRLAISGDGTFRQNLSVKIQDPFGMIAIKKVETNTTSGDVWVIIGIVEVVS